MGISPHHRTHNDPIVLSNPLAQSYAPHHHNFTETFLIEPRLDPSVPQSTLDELKSKDIMIIYWHNTSPWVTNNSTTWDSMAVREMWPLKNLLFTKL